jgi:hypothetical protein
VKATSRYARFDELFADKSYVITKIMKVQVVASNRQVNLDTVIFGADSGEFNQIPENRSRKY